MRRTTKGENAGRLLRICAACLRKDDWHRFGLVERHGGAVMPYVGKSMDRKRNSIGWPEDKGPVALLKRALAVLSC